MYLHFNFEHIDTIHDLCELAKKHNCKIRIDVCEDNVSVDDWKDCILSYLENKEGMSEQMRKEFEFNYDLDNLFYKHDYVTFELVDMKDKENWKHQFLQFHEIEFYFTFNENHKRYLDDYCEISQELDDWLEENVEYDDFLGMHNQYTVVSGFKKQKTEVNVYREGMALKFFGDLVCDYLKEPRIVRCY